MRLKVTGAHRAATHANAIREERYTEGLVFVTRRSDRTLSVAR
jgi:hypothetical protein